MTSRWMLVASVLAVLPACRRAEQRTARRTAGADTAVASELRQAADTAAFSDAADVAMRDIPDSTLPMPPKRRMIAHAPGQPLQRGSSSTPSASTSPSRVTTHSVPVMRPAPSVDVRPAIPPASPVSPPMSPAGDASLPTPACDSPTMSDQRRCLLAYLAQSDQGLDHAYQARIRRLRSEAGTPLGAPDPDAVHMLRSAQRAWLVYRDTECRNRNRGHEGPLWAPVRARCLGEFSRARADELTR